MIMNWAPAHPFPTRVASYGVPVPICGKVLSPEPQHFTEKSSSKAQLCQAPAATCWAVLPLPKSTWLVVDLPLRKMMEFVSWDDDIPFPIYGKSNKTFQTTNQQLLRDCLPFHLHHHRLSQCSQGQVDHSLHGPNLTRGYARLCICTFQWKDRKARHPKPSDGV